MKNIEYHNVYDIFVVLVFIGKSAYLSTKPNSFYFNNEA